MWHWLSDNYFIFIGQLPQAALHDIKYTAGYFKGHPYIAVRATRENRERLEARGLKAPSLEEKYKYTGFLAPLEHQKGTVKEIVKHKRIYVANDIGTGKTKAALWAFDCLKKGGYANRMLVVAPKNTLLFTWDKECAHTVSYRKRSVCLGDRKRRFQILKDPNLEIVIINPDALDSMIKLHDFADFDMVIVDEATDFKTQKAIRSKALEKIIKGKRVVMMSGTPSPQAPTDAYNQIRLMRDGNYKSFYWFRDMTMYQVNKFKWLPKTGASEFVAKELAPCVRYKRNECIQLPDLQIIDKEIELTEEQKETIRQIKEDYATELKDKPITAVNAAAVYSKVMQILCGVVYSDIEDEDSNKVAVELESSNLLTEIRAIVEEAGSPVLIFTPFRASLFMIERKLKEEGFRVNSIHKDKSMAERTDIMNAIQSKDIDAVVAIPKTVSKGLTLTGSHIIIWVVPPSSYLDWEQANGRIWRHGQKDKCLIYRLISDKFSKAVVAAIEGRSLLQDSLLKALEE